MPPTVPRTARERARTEITAEILDTAHSPLADAGAAALSLRAVARDVGMVSSAVYRYVPNRDALLTMLVIDAYNGLGAAVEKAEAAVARGDHLAAAGTAPPAQSLPPAVEASIAPIKRLAGGGVGDDLLLRGLAAWSGLYGSVSFELFGHLHDVIASGANTRKAYFDHQMRRVAQGLGLGSCDESA